MMYNIPKSKGQHLENKFPVALIFPFLFRHCGKRYLFVLCPFPVFPSIEPTPEHLVDRPATDMPVCPQSFSQSGNPALSLFFETPYRLPDCPTNEGSPHSEAWGVTHK